VYTTCTPRGADLEKEGVWSRRGGGRKGCPFGVDEKSIMQMKRWYLKKQQFQPKRWQYIQL